MEMIKTMLAQRGIVDESVSIDPGEISASITKIGRIVVFQYSKDKSRVNPKDIQTASDITKQNGGDLVMLVLEYPQSDNILSIVKRSFENVQLFHAGQLLINITQHRKVPLHRVLSAEERDAVMKKFHVTNLEKLPQIDSHDTMALWCGARPGDVVEITRKSETAGATPYYRRCVADVTV